jgi:hydrogenase maturation factor HypF (carbamoyltransferase family)
MKKCTKCGVRKPLSEFYPRTEDKAKAMALCKPCSNARSRKNYRQNKSSKEGHAKQIFQKRKRQAKYLSHYEN